MSCKPSSFAAFVAAGLLGFALAPSCGGSTAAHPGGADAGGDAPPTDGPPVPPAQAYVRATLGPSADPKSLGACTVGSTTTVLQLGADPGTGLPMTILDGGGAAISCIVRADGSGFDVSLSVDVPGSAGATLMIQSTQGQPVTMQGGAMLTGSLDSGAQGYGNYTSMACTFDTMNCRASGGMCIAPGRIWGHVSCATASDPSAIKMLPDGGTTTATCGTEIDLLFQDCQM